MIVSYIIVDKAQEYIESDIMSTLNSDYEAALKNKDMIYRAMVACTSEVYSMV